MEATLYLEDADWVGSEPTSAELAILSEWLSA